MDVAEQIRCYFCLIVFFLATFIQVNSLRCYHDKYAPDPTLLNQMEGDNSVTNKGANLVKQCGSMEMCESCMTINTEIKRYERGQGLKAYRTTSRVCVREKGLVKREKAGCEGIGRASDWGSAEICHCYHDMCNT